MANVDKKNATSYNTEKGTVDLVITLSAGSETDTVEFTASGWKQEAKEVDEAQAKAKATTKLTTARTNLGTSATTTINDAKTKEVSASNYANVYGKDVVLSNESKLQLSAGHTFDNEVVYTVRSIKYLADEGEIELALSLSLKNNPYQVASVPVAKFTITGFATTESLKPAAPQVDEAANQKLAAALTKLGTSAYTTVAKAKLQAVNSANYNTIYGKGVALDQETLLEFDNDHGLTDGVNYVFNNISFAKADEGIIVVDIRVSLTNSLSTVISETVKDFQITGFATKAELAALNDNKEPVSEVNADQKAVNELKTYVEKNLTAKYLTTSNQDVKASEVDYAVLEASKFATDFPTLKQLLDKDTSVQADTIKVSDASDTDGTLTVTVTLVKGEASASVVFKTTGWLKDSEVNARLLAKEVAQFGTEGKTLIVGAVNLLATEVVDQFPAGTVLSESNVALDSKYEFNDEFSYSVVSSKANMDGGYITLKVEAKDSNDTKQTFDFKLKGFKQPTSSEKSNAEKYISTTDFIKEFTSKLAGANTLLASEASSSYVTFDNIKSNVSHRNTIYWADSNLIKTTVNKVSPSDKDGLIKINIKYTNRFVPSQFIEFDFTVTGFQTKAARETENTAALDKEIARIGTYAITKTNTDKLPSELSEVVKVGYVINDDNAVFGNEESLDSKFTYTLSTPVASDEEGNFKSSLTVEYRGSYKSIDFVLIGFRNTQLSEVVLNSFATKALTPKVETSVGTEKAYYFVEGSSSTWGQYVSLYVNDKALTWNAYWKSIGVLDYHNYYLPYFNINSNKIKSRKYDLLYTGNSNLYLINDWMKNGKIGSSGREITNIKTNLTAFTYAMLEVFPNEFLFDSYLYHDYNVSVEFEIGDIESTSKTLPASEQKQSTTPENNGGRHAWYRGTSMYSDVNYEFKIIYTITNKVTKVVEKREVKQKAWIDYTRMDTVQLREYDVASFYAWQVMDDGSLKQYENPDLIIKNYKEQ